MKAKKSIRTIRLIPAVIAIAPAVAIAGPDAKDVIVEPTPAAASPWEFQLTPYGWLTGLDGTTGVDGINMDVDAPFFNDILDNLKMAAALNFEARNGKWGFIIDGFYADLGSGGSIQGTAYKSASLDLKQFIGQATVAYRVHESPNAFVDVFAGARYNGMWVDIGAVIDPAGVTTISTNASNSLVTAVDAEAQAIVDPRIQEYQSASAAERATIESELQASIESDAAARVKDNVERELVEIRRDNGLSPETILLDRFSDAIKQEAVALAEATAELKIAQLRFSENPSLQSEVNKAQKKVDKANKDLTKAIDTQLSDDLPTDGSGNKSWVDPIIGVRGQYNFNDKWFVAGSADIGGFGVGSDITWSAEAMVGYNFTSHVSAELGYRYMYTDYSDDGFLYDMAQAGIYTGLSIRF